MVQNTPADTIVFLYNGVPKSNREAICQIAFNWGLETLP